MTVSIHPSIIERCKKGDKSAFREIVVAYQRMVFSLAFRMLCDEEEAKDIVQETFIRVWLKIEEYDPSRNLITWIYSIAAHLCLDRIRQKERWAEIMEDDGALQEYVDDTSPDHLLENRQLGAVIRSLVSQLSPQQRLAFSLVYLEGLTVAEASVVASIDANRLKSNLYVARQNIRQRLIELGYEPGPNR